MKKIVETVNFYLSIFCPLSLHLEMEVLNEEDLPVSVALEYSKIAYIGDGYKGFYLQNAEFSNIFEMF